MPTVSASEAHISLEDLLPLLDHARRFAAGQYSCHCPAHDDRHNSLSVGQDSAGNLLLHCHAGSSFDAVLAAFRSQLAPARPTQGAGRQPYTTSAPFTPGAAFGAPCFVFTAFTQSTDPPSRPSASSACSAVSPVPRLWRWRTDKIGLPRELW